MPYAWSRLHSRRDLTVTPALNLTQADLRDGFKGTYHVKPPVIFGESSSGEKVKEEPYQGTAQSVPFDVGVEVQLSYKGGGPKR